MKDTITLKITDTAGAQHEVIAPTDMGLNLMEAIRLNEIAIKAVCGGMALCASCHVIIKSAHLLPNMSDEEEAMLDEAFLLHIANSRLSCQIQITPEMDGLEFFMGESTID